MPRQTAFSEEKAELNRVLTSPSFTKSPNLSRLLAYLCNKYVEGNSQDLNEYSIGVEALGRTPDFDPGMSSIVRVEAHRLREKLNRYYETEGADHPMVIVLEAGGYIPQFVKREKLAGAVEKRLARPSTNSPADEPPAGTASPLASDESTAGTGEIATPAVPDSHRSLVSTLGMRLTILAAGLLVVILILVVYTWRFENRQGNQTFLATPSGGVPPSSVAIPGEEIRILCGYSKENYIDRAGSVWQGDRFFKGGAIASAPQQTFTRTLDPTIYQQSRTGDFSYDIPLKKGVYELRLFFTEAEFGPTTFSGGGESSRVFDVEMNGKPLIRELDIYREAAGNNTAYERVFKDVEPASDGAVHLRFRTTSREKPVVSALAIVPGIPGKMRPVRLVAREGSYTDRVGRVWSPDRYFLHGRLASHKGPVQNTPDPDLYSSERYGNFDYAIPVDAAGTYAVTLRFAETYFGQTNNGWGGKGSRIFNVYCNGVTLLHNFDIFAEAGGANLALEKTFHGLKPNAQGLLDFSFIPSVNYAEVNAIEVVDESR